MASDIIFYHNPMSRGQIVRWMLEEVGVPYDTDILDYSSGMKSEEYRAINPMMKVPAIAHNGRVVTEGAAICAYLADAFPETGLGPRDEEKADYYRWMFFASGPLEQAITNKAMGYEHPAEKNRMFGYGNFELTVDTLDQWLQGRNFICGDRFTAADVYVGSQVMAPMEFGMLPKRDSFLAYAERLTQREAYMRGKEEDNRLIAEMQAAG